MTIKSMKLYGKVERIYNELAELGKSSEDSLSEDELSHFDQLHHHVTYALDTSVSMLGLQDDQQTLRGDCQLAGVYHIPDRQKMLTGKLGGIHLCAKRC